MLKYSIFLFILLQNWDGFAQFNRNNFSINVGGQLANTFSKPFYAYSYDEGGIIHKQQSALFYDLNFAFRQTIKKSKISTILGVGLTQKGYCETGQAYEIYGYGGHYKDKFTYDYYSIFLGGSYKLTSKKKAELSLSQLLICEMSKFHPGLLEKYAYSTRTNLTATYTLKNKRNLLLTTYFQAPLVKYNIEKSYPWSSNYWPYSYGINIGISLKDLKKK